MTLLITLTAAVISTVVWYNFANREKVNEVKAKIDKTIVYFGNLWEKFV